MAAPHTSQAAAAGARGGVRGELAVELGEERNTVGEPKFGAGRTQRGVLRQRRKKLAPGSGWNTRLPAPQGTWTKIGIAIVGLVLGWLCYSIASNILTYMHTTPEARH